MQIGELVYSLMPRILNKSDLELEPWGIGLNLSSMNPNRPLLPTIEPVMGQITADIGNIAHMPIGAVQASLERSAQEGKTYELPEIFDRFDVKGTFNLPRWFKEALRNSLASEHVYFRDEGVISSPEPFLHLGSWYTNGNPLQLYVKVKSSPEPGKFHVGRITLPKNYFYTSYGRSLPVTLDEESRRLVKDGGIHSRYVIASNHGVITSPDNTRFEAPFYIPSDEVNDVARWWSHSRTAPTANVVTYFSNSVH